MRAIDADALIEEVKKYANEPLKLHDRRWTSRCTAIIEDMIGTIKMQPTLDAVPVVRCKDCVYRGAVQCALATEGNQYCPGVDPDWFCAKGRRAKHETP